MQHPLLFSMPSVVHPVFSSPPGNLLKNTAVILLIISLQTVSLSVRAQTGATKIAIDQALESVKTNLQLTINRQQILKGEQQVKTASSLSKTGVFVENEDMNPDDKTGILKIGVSQSLSWPGLYKAQRQWYREQLTYHTLNTRAIGANLKKEVRRVYYQLWYLQEKAKLYGSLDSLYHSLLAATVLRVKTGDRPRLDSLAASVRLQEIRSTVLQIKEDIAVQQRSLKQLLNTDMTYLPVDSPLTRLPFLIAQDDSLHPAMMLQNQLLHIASAGTAVIRNENRPEFSGRFFSQQLYGISNPYSGFSVSMGFPLFNAGATKNKVRVAQAEMRVQALQNDYQLQLFTSEREKIKKEVQKNNAMLLFYEKDGLRQAAEIIDASAMAYRAGEISFADLSQFLTQSIHIRQNYLESLNAYNQSVIQYYYFINH